MALIGENDRIDRIVSGIIGFIFESASLNPYRLKFQIMLLNDFSTKIDPGDPRTDSPDRGDTDPQRT